MNVFSRNPPGRRNRGKELGEALAPNFMAGGAAQSAAACQGEGQYGAGRGGVGSFSSPGTTPAGQHPLKGTVALAWDRGITPLLCASNRLENGGGPAGAAGAAGARLPSGLAELAGWPPPRALTWTTNYWTIGTKAVSPLSSHTPAACQPRPPRHDATRRYQTQQGGAIWSFEVAPRPLWAARSLRARPAAAAPRSDLAARGEAPSSKGVSSICPPR